MPNLFSCPPGVDLSRKAAEWLLAQHTPNSLADTVVFVPTRRAAVSLRHGFSAAAKERGMLLPRIIPLAAIGEAFPALLKRDAFSVLQSIPPAMSDYEQRYLLTQQVAAFEAKRNPGGAVRLDQSLALAEELMVLQDECARHEIMLSDAKLSGIARGDFAAHWETALQFLRILSESWPAIEAALRQTTQAARETRLLRALAEYWETNPPPFAVYAIGSTASQPATAALLARIAQLPNGAVFLPGLDTAIAEKEWNSIAAGHPLHHLKQFLLQLNVPLDAVHSLESAPRSLWQEVFLPTSLLPEWRTRSLPPYQSVRLVPCQQGEEEARAIALLMREGIEHEGRTALITPDEGLMMRVAAQLKTFGIAADRQRAGSIATTEAGSLWTQLAQAIAEPERLLHLRHLLHHARSSIASDYLAQLDAYLHKRAPRKPGQLPWLPEPLQLHQETARVEKLARQCAKLSPKHYSAAEWVIQLRGTHSLFADDWGEGSELLSEALNAIESVVLPSMGIAEFRALLAERLEAPWRDPSAKFHPRLLMLTPAEARLEHFERVILGNMQERVWPGTAQTGPWLNLAARQELGLPSPEEAVSLMAHDVLVHGSAPEVFITWPVRENGSPTTRSRFVERLITLLAMHGITEESITDSRVSHWARTEFNATDFSPATPPRPIPNAVQRPKRLPVSRLDRLFTDPYAIYAEFVLGLRKLDALDAEPEPRDFGTLTHAAILALTTHWNETGVAASDEQLAQFTDRALRGYDDEPVIGQFWRRRLMNALRFVNDEESKRRTPGMRVEGEVKTEANLALSDKVSMMLHGRIDRMEQGTIGDYKTGEIPSEKDILAGHALQLLCYALLCEAAGQKPEAIEYWQLPHARRVGFVQRTEWNILEEAALPEKLREALARMLDADTPFLAKPAADAWNDDYDGVNRYDEWAG